MNGNASGNTEISARRTLSARSRWRMRVPDSRANTISSAMRNSNKSAEDAERLEADAHEGEEARAAEREEHQDEPGDQHRLERHLVLVAGDWHRR